MFILGLVIVMLVLIFLFWFLLSQSKKPTGLIGILMMRLWNGVYLPLVEWAINNVNLNDYSAILDIGVGNGASSAYLLQRKNSLSITGIDLSETAISQAYKKYPDNKINFESMDVHHLTFTAETFDLVTAFQTHFHWSDLDQALREIYRVLKPNGVVIFACETAKINYFLPKLKNSADFQRYLSTFDFSLINQQTTSQWTMYTCKKNKMTL